jgi:GMP synthase-like glutamine amidotransferase
MKPVLVRQHLDVAPPGLLAEWLGSRGFAYELSPSWADGAPLEPEDYAFVVSLGHEMGVADAHDRAVAAEVRLIGRAVERGVPVLGLCFGGQVLASVLGGRVEPAATPELGWREIETDDPDLVPAGPWLEWHFDRFTTPPAAEEIARTAAATQAFVSGPHLGTQFHPETTTDIVTGWARLHATRLPALGIDDAEALLAASPQQRAAARDAAFRLFDAFVERQITE